MPSQNDNGGRRGPWGGGAKPGSDLGDLVRQGQDRVQQIMPSGGLRPAIVLAVIALVGLGVQSRSEVGWIASEAVWLICPRLTDRLVGR